MERIFVCVAVLAALPLAAGQASNVVATVTGGYVEATTPTTLKAKATFATGISTANTDTVTLAFSSAILVASSSPTVSASGGGSYGTTSVNGAGTTLTLTLTSGSISAGATVTFSITNNLAALPTSGTAVTLTVSSSSDSASSATTVFTTGETRVTSASLSGNDYVETTTPTAMTIVVLFQNGISSTGSDTVTLTFDQAAFTASQTPTVSASGTGSPVFGTTATDTDGKILTLTLTGGQISAGATITFTVSNQLAVMPAAGTEFKLAAASTGDAASSAEYVYRSLGLTSGFTAQLTGGYVESTTPTNVACTATFSYGMSASDDNPYVTVTYNVALFQSSASVSGSISGLGLGSATSNTAGTSVTFTVNSGSISSGASKTINVGGTALAALPAAGTVVTCTARSNGDAFGTAANVFQTIPMPTITFNPAAWSMHAGLTFTSIDLVVTLAHDITSGNTIVATFDEAVLGQSVTSGLTVTGAAGTSYTTDSDGKVFTLTTNANAARGTVVNMNLGSALMVSLPLISAFVGVIFTANSIDLTVNLIQNQIILPPSSGSDPLAKYGDRQVEFELPPNVLTPLVSSSDLKLFGSVFEGRSSREQWFERMVITSELEDRFLEIRMKSNLGQQNKSRIPKGQLRTVDVVLGYGNYSSPSVTSQVLDMNTRIPQSFLGQDIRFRTMARNHWATFTSIAGLARECLDMAGSTLHLYICSSPATEFFGEKRELSRSFAHLDMVLVEIRYPRLITGLLPELWGLQPMSNKTREYLKLESEGLPQAGDEKTAAFAGAIGMESILEDCKENTASVFA